MPSRATTASGVVDSERQTTPDRGATVAIDPTAGDLAQLLADDPGGPVVMLNLLRFRPDGGREPATPW